MKKLMIMIGVVGAVGTAHADHAATAYTRGQAALKAKKIHEACELFADSEQTRAAVETEIALAGCLELDGKLLAAAKMYRVAAEKDPNAKRKQASTDKAAKLDARAPKLRFAINPKPDDIVIKVDGVIVPSTGDVMVDLGPHEVVGTAAGFEGRANAPVDREGQVLDVILRMESTAPVAPPTPEPPPVVTPPAEPALPPEPSQPVALPPPVEPMNTNTDPHRGRNGAIIGGVGVASVVAGVVMFTVGSGKLDDEHAICPDHMCVSQADADRANSLRDDGRLYRGLGIGLGIGGAALIAVGVWMFATAPDDEAPAVALTIDHGGGVLSYGFGF